MSRFENDSLWFPIVRSDHEVKLRLFCLPFAGGNAFSYRLWQNHLPDSVDVCPIQLPGRSNRINEPCFSDIKLLVETLIIEIGRYTEIPFAVFGHSMGALIGFELIRSLTKLGKSPLHFFPSSAKAPDCCERTVKLHNLTSKKLKAELLKLSGTAKEVLDHPELFNLLLPTLRADFKIIDDYQYKFAEPLNCLITTFGGYDDQISQNDLLQWERHTSSGFRCQMFEGNHFYLNEQTEPMLSAIYFDLRAYL
jgi:surfactin synthase thioesterase subunit